MEKKDTILVIAFDIMQGGKSVLTGYPAKNAYSVVMGHIKPDSIYLGDISSRVAQFVQYLHLQYAQDGLFDQQIRDIEQSGKASIIEVAFPLKLHPLQNYSCGITETGNIRENRTPEPTQCWPPGHHSLYGEAGEVIDYSAG